MAQRDTRRLVCISEQNISSGISLYLFVLCLWYLIHATGGRSSGKQIVFHVTDKEAKFNYVTVNRSCNPGNIKALCVGFLTNEMQHVNGKITHHFAIKS
jgi:hypothetical protein